MTRAHLGRVMRQYCNARQTIKSHSVGTIPLF